MSISWPADGYDDDDDDENKTKPHLLFGICDLIAWFLLAGDEVSLHVMIGWFDSISGI